MNRTEADYYMSLPKKRMGAGVLFLNAAGEVLLVKPTYKETWEIPGGVVEENESPRDAVVREVKEELGLTISAEFLTLGCVEYMAAGSNISEALMFLFHGGVLQHIEFDKIHLDLQEIEKVKFVAKDGLKDLLGEGLGSRVYRTLVSTVCLYSEGKYD